MRQNKYSARRKKLSDSVRQKQAHTTDQRLFFESLARVLDHYLADERNDYEASLLSIRTNHIYCSLKNLKRILLKWRRAAK